MMIKRVVQLFFCLSPVLLFAQNPVNVIDGNGLKQGEWKKYNDDNELIYTGQFKDDIPFGTFTYFYQDGKKKAELTYSATQIGEATVINYHENGKIMATGMYLNKLRHGAWVFFDETENRICEEQYDEGKKTGIWKTYYFDGELNEEVTYAEDEKNGPWIQYFTDGAVKVQGLYINGLLEGETRFYQPDGEVMVIGSYIHNLKEGIWKFFDEKGNLVKEQEYDKGKLLTDPTENE